MPYTKTYFLCPTSDFFHPSPVGPLDLGSIITSTSKPQYPLNRANLVRVPNPDPSIHQPNWRETLSTVAQSKPGLYAKFAQLATGGLGLGPEVAVEKHGQAHDFYAFDQLTTRSFDPTPEYVGEAIKAPGVQFWLDQPMQRFAPRSTLYLVTGLKLARGARIQYSSSAGTGLTANVAIDVPPLGITIGPKVHWETKTGHATTFNRDSEFVFAFCVKKLIIGRKIEIKDYHKGALLAENEGYDGDDDLEVILGDVDGSSYDGATLASDEITNDTVYCVLGE